jgi:membrane protease YdiL (CAAX protease family)
MNSSSALLDIVGAIVLFTAVYFGLHALDLPAPGTFALLATLVFATWRLATAAGSGWTGAWASVGLRTPPSWLRLLLWVIGIYVAVIATNIAIVVPLGRALGWAPLDLSRFAGLQGNPARLALWLLVAWTTAAVGEELVFRGFLLTRLQTLFGPEPVAIAAAVVLQAALFAVGHAYLGIRGTVSAGVVALVFGTVYYFNGRQLLPLMVAHGLIDSVSLLAIFAGAAGARPG